MKKLIIILFVFTVIVLCGANKKEVLIPSESIRYRIIASDDNSESQKLKWEVNKDVIPILIDNVSTSSDINHARNSIKDSIESINNTVSKYTNEFTVNYGINYFPEKKYNNIKYNDGNYESLVITLGQGEGKNFWCVLFPPLCLLEAQKSNIDDVKYEFYVKKIINKYF